MSYFAITWNKYYQRWCDSFTYVHLKWTSTYRTECPYHAILVKSDQRLYINHFITTPTPFLTQITNLFEIAPVPYSVVLNLLKSVFFLGYEGLKRGRNSVRQLILRVSDQLQAGEIRLVESTPEESKAAKARLDTNRKKRRERYKTDSRS